MWWHKFGVAVNYFLVVNVDAKVKQKENLMIVYGFLQLQFAKILYEKYLRMSYT